MMLETKSSPNSTVSSIGTVLILIGLAFIYFYTAPQIKTTKLDKLKAAATESQKATELATLQQAQGDLQSKEYQLQSQGVTLSSLSSVMPATEDMPSLYIQLENLMNNVPNVKTPSYTLGEPALTKSGEVRIPVTFNATGRYPDLKNFITTMENNIRPVTFSTVDLSQSSTTSTSGTAATPGDFTLTATGYFRALSVSSAYAESASSASN